MRRKLTEEQEQEICRLYQEDAGNSSIELGKRFGVCDVTVLNVLKEHNVPRRTAGRGNWAGLEMPKWEADKRRVAMHTVAVSDKMSLAALRRHHGKDVVALDDNIICDEYATKKTLQAVGIGFGVSRSYIKRVLRNNCVRLRSTSEAHQLQWVGKARVPFDWSIYPLTPEKYWLLGLLYGDGNLGRNRKTIKLFNSGKDIIDK
ncbi:MAG: hypothetical protein KKD44_28605, partial [Proteobacteria bacterium]|nr:hypothetical protein [Pseudomonadota bacterium]